MRKSIPVASPGRRLLGRLAAAFLLAAALSTPTTLAWAAASAVSMPSVLIVDAGLGDVVYYGTHWLGQPEQVAVQGDLRLLTSAAPTWWGSGTAPDTYVLTASDASGSVAATPLDSGGIAWALDRIAEKHPGGTAVIVAQGAAGLVARAYLEDLATPRQSDRADAVGLVMFGTPNSGLTLPKQYPDMQLWTDYPAGAGLAPAELQPSSALLQALDAGRLPAVLKTLVVEGIAAQLAAQESDGVAVRGDSQLATGVAVGPVDKVLVHARATQAYSLRDAWFSQTSKGGKLADAVDGAQVERLAPMPGYVTDAETRAAVRTFYETWFTNGSPTTHISTRLVMDVSGSMAAKLGGGTKLAASKRAAKDFLGSLIARQSVPGAVPEDVGLVTFNERARVTASAGSSPKSVLGDINALRARGNTDVGKALSAAVETFVSTPKPAEKVVVLLSDGVNTAGLNEKQILSGPVARAKKNDIRIETIALGGVGSADTAFLKKIASSTGGSFHQARDLFELRRDFLRARYASLGDLAVDKGVNLSSKKPVELGRVDESVRLIEIAAVPDGAGATWTLQRDGKPVDTSEIATSKDSDGVYTIALASPKPGTYRLVASDAKGASRAHVFVVTQVDAFKRTTSVAPPDDTPMMILIGVAIAGVLAIVVTIIFSRRKVVKSDALEAEPSEELPQPDQDGE